MENLNYESETVLDYLPNKVDLTEQMKLSEDVKARRFVVIQPPNVNLENINNTSLNNVSQFKISSSSEWADFMNACLVATVTEVILPDTSATMKYNLVTLDGKYALINRVTTTVGGVEVNMSNNNFSTHRNAKYLNECMISNYMSDALVLNPGNSKLVKVLANPSTVPTATNFYTDLTQGTSNFINCAGAAPASASALCRDSYGFNTVAAVANPAQFGYQNAVIQDTTSQIVTIPLSDLIGLFNVQKYFPLFAVGEVIINIHWNSPNNAFFTDAVTLTAGGAYQAPASVTSYDLVDIKIVCDMITCSESLNNSYKMRAMSKEGLNLVYDDWTVQNSSAFNVTSGNSHQMQVNLSSSSVKSLLFYLQGQENYGNSWKNSHFPYLGIQHFQTQINNQNVPPTPLSNSTDMILYSNRSRGVIGNELSQFVANSPFLQQLLQRS
jgi:hypothetical protein